MPLDIQREISFIKDNLPHGDKIANALLRISQSVNKGFSKIATDPETDLEPPPPLASLNVKTDGNGNVHAVIDHPGEINRGVHYFIEAANNPSFFGAHTIHASTSRTMKPTPLPANDDDGAPQMFYFRAFPQYPGGQPGKPINFGGNAPTALAVGGTANMTLLSSRGSGTGQNSQDGIGVGFGKVIVRPGGGPKRSS